MFRIDSPATAAALAVPAAPGGTIGYFTEGDPVNSVPATVVSADWLNTIQEELMAIVLGAGIVPAKATRNQVLTSIQKLIQQGGQTAGLTKALANNQAAAADVTGFPTLDSTVVRAFEAFITIMRRTDSGYVKQTGRLYGTYDTETATWDLSVLTVHDDAGVVFTMALVGGTVWKLQYTTDNFAGASYAGTLKISDIQFNLV